MIDHEEDGEDFDDGTALSRMYNQPDAQEVVLHHVECARCGGSEEIYDGDENTLEGLEADGWIVAQKHFGGVGGDSLCPDHNDEAEK